MIGKINAENKDASEYFTTKLAVKMLLFALMYSEKETVLSG